MASAIGSATSDEASTQADATDRQSTDPSDDLILSAESDLQPTLSVVMPTLDEEEGIAECIEQIRSAVRTLGIPTEIIVSDSSSDRTPEIARSMGAIVLEPDGVGYGYAYQYAFKRCRGEYIAMGDADTTYDFEDIPDLLEFVVEGNADMAMGSRLDGEIRPGSMPPLHQYVGNPLLTAFLNVFYDAGVSDAHSGMRVFTRDAWVMMECGTTGMEFASEMIMEAGAKELEIAETPIVYHEREGEETLDSFTDGWRHVRFMLVNAPGYLFSVPGLLMSLTGLLVMSVAYGGLSISGVTLGTNSMIAGSLITILGMEVASLGVFSAVASNPIRRPTDPVTNWITENATLEWGATAGITMFSAGAAYALWLVIGWITSGFGAVPFTLSALIAFTAIVIGAQTVFSSFFLSSIK